jgi:hypothetical protein
MPGAVGGKKVAVAYLRVQFKVERIWKGISGTTVFVTTSLGEASCGFPFIRGTKYLVYASARKGQKNLSAILCSRTRPLPTAQGELDTLENG